MPDARSVALKVLLSLRHGAWSDTVLRNAIRTADLDRRDAAFCTALCYGVVQNRILLDYTIAAYSTIKMNKIAPTVTDILRMGIYQICFMDRVPNSAAVNESVKLTRNNANPRAAGFVNAILRKTTVCGIPQITENDRLTALSIRYSHPEPLVRRFCDIFGFDDTEKLLKIDNAVSPVSVRINTLRSSVDETVIKMESEQMTVILHPEVPNAAIIENMGNLDNSPAFKNGLFTVQDTASQICASVVDAQPGDNVLDLCAAPGGKSFALAACMQNHGSILCCDLYPNKLELIDNDAERLGIKIIQTIPNDASVMNPALCDRFDRVLADVPCSGLGVIRKKPDIRYRSLEESSALPALQRSILDKASCYVKKGGIIVYSTCTLLPEENEYVVRDFLCSHSEFVAEDFLIPIAGPCHGMVTLKPHVHNTDGFFIAKLRRKQ